MLKEIGSVCVSEREEGRLYKRRGCIREGGDGRDGRGGNEREGEGMGEGKEGDRLFFTVSSTQAIFRKWKRSRQVGVTVNPITVSTCYVMVNRLNAVLCMHVSFGSAVPVSEWL